MQPVGQGTFVIQSTQKTQTVSGQPLRTASLRRLTADLWFSPTTLRTGRHARIAAFSRGYNDQGFGSLQAVLHRATDHQTFGLRATQGLRPSWTWAKFQQPCTAMRCFSSLSGRRASAGSLLRSAECGGWGGAGTQRPSELHQLPSRGLWPAGSSGV